MLRKTAPLLILLAAFALRAWQITAIPPGLTHDEAGHGHDAAYVLKGVTPIYFTVGYGREPLFDYLNAGLIGGVGASPFTLRFAAIAWGMIALAGTYRVARLALDRRTAMIALALMAFSFWPLATSRQILRSGMLPAEMAIAVILYFKLLTTENTESTEKKRWLLTIALGVALAASFYTYIPARVLWLMFPLAALARFARRSSRVTPSGHTSRFTFHVLLSALIAFALASPLFIYLYQHPEAEQRIGMLSEPLVALGHGNLLPIIANARETFLAFFLPGHGDHFLAYTIPGKPIFDPITALLFVVGLFLLLTPTISRRQSASIPHTHTPLLLLWLLLGLAPSFITGPEAMMTRIIGAQPVLYVLPALALSRLTTAFSRQRSAISAQPQTTSPASFDIRRAKQSLFIVSLFIVSLFLSTSRNYFFIWAQSPDVRAAYQSTLIAALKTIDRPAVISTVYPSAAHDPYIAELITNVETRWTDGRSAMIIPAEPGFQVIVPSSTPLHPAFVNLVQPIQTVTLRPGDLDPSFTVYVFLPPSVIGLGTSGDGDEANFDNAVKLTGYRWSASSYRPGDVAELITTWRLLDPAQLGAVHPPAFKSDLNLFTHVLNADGTIFLQRDSLDAPAWDWQSGDTIIQTHQFAVPADAKAGGYAAEVGLYDRVTGERLTVIDSGAASVAIAPLIIRK